MTEALEEVPESASAAQPVPPEDAAADTPMADAGDHDVAAEGTAPEVPAPLGVPQPKAVRRRRGAEAGGRDKADLTLAVTGGRLSFYRKSQICTATCTNELHGRCVLTRSMVAGRSPAQGRPLGLLLSWLEMGITVDTKLEHWDRDCWPTLSEREAARTLFLHVEGAQPFLDEERPLRPGEPEEPVERA